MLYGEQVVLVLLIGLQLKFKTKTRYAGKRQKKKRLKRTDSKTTNKKHATSRYSPTVFGVQHEGKHIKLLLSKVLSAHADFNATF